MKQLNQNYTVSGQITAQEVPEIAAAGYRSIICNRPDHEIPEFCNMKAIQQAAENAGLSFLANPFCGQSFCAENVEIQKSGMDDLPGPVFAYCATGNRCTMIWALAQAGTKPADELIEAAAAQGYAIGHLRPMLGG